MLDAETEIVKLMAMDFVLLFISLATQTRRNTRISQFTTQHSFLSVFYLHPLSLYLSLSAFFHVLYVTHFF